MERKTLLQMTKDILEMMESDLVASINDTLESQMVHREIRNTYMHLMARQEWEHLKNVTHLDPTSVLTPTTLSIPDNVSEIKELHYDQSVAGGRLNMVKMEYLTPSNFLRMCQTRDTTAANVVVVNEDPDIELPIIIDKEPEYWTCFDNKRIVFDSYNAANELVAALSSTKSQALVISMPAWDEDDAFVPDMPPQLFPLLVYEAAEACMELHDKEQSETISRRALTHKALLKKRNIRHDGKAKKGFGRR